ncbi:TPA: hypothetical protein NKO82_004528 [Vibrio parahaemolyticus]|uniref:hypothetical protein n=1 Tax=Vibrio parahaemolyticus TaxID=670 RepID=UPI00111CC138|nr:hypothetical protein [Vibrio parahaemolyticus]TOP03406.1 hypothetical protein CGH27_18165 [Vibrio parahaemolyticus]TOP10453.1 hypothetical protein CGH26_16905 [Vibrio parahaemolyticus]HCE5112932.1 hypothetical protein [Vibrio parahaemolyticus]HCE5127288.1 hypothetical protein [Vibrio parahaemolyticus]HCE5189030.1 hypothetical protein [Vibrio parahaemolyticus]
MNTELKQAQELHTEAVEMLRQSRQMHDLTMSNQRSLVYALSCLLPKHMVTVKADFSDQPENTAQQISDNARCVLEAIEKREVYDIVHAINVLAMANADVIHIFTRYQGHVDRFFISVEKVETDYSNINRPYLFNDDVSLKDESSLEELLSIESQLTELIIEAREQAEAKAEVEA